MSTSTATTVRRSASHQTGWTGVVAKLLQQSGDRVTGHDRAQIALEVPELETVSGR